MASTAAQKAASEKAKNAKLLAEAKAMLAERKAKLAELEAIKDAEDMQKAMEARGTARKTAAAKDAEYAAYLENPITSQYDPRIYKDTSSDVNYDRPTPAVTTVVEPPKVFPKAGTILEYLPGSNSESRIPVYHDGYGGTFEGEEVPNPVKPGSTGFSDTSFTESTEITLASNTFANTVALLMGELEAGQPWVEELRKLSQGFINSGSTTEEAINLALRDAKAQGKASKFVQRFDAIFKLQDRLNAGEAVQVPSIADYVKSEQALGDVFRNVGMPELATQAVTSKVLGEANKSVSEATAIISDIFGAIDNAPAALKADLQAIAPGADRTAIAKALLFGKAGIAELTKSVASISQVSAAKSQGITIDSAMGSELAAGGAEYGTSLTKFAEVKRLERGQSLGRMSNINFTQQDAIDSTFTSSAAADEKIRRIEEEERNRFAARSGYLPSQNRSRDF
jgi:hypothetical protein